LVLKYQIKKTLSTKNPKAHDSAKGEWLRGRMREETMKRVGVEEVLGGIEGP